MRIEKSETTGLGYLQFCTSPIKLAVPCLIWVIAMERLFSGGLIYNICLNFCLVPYPASELLKWLAFNILGFDFLTSPVLQFLFYFFFMQIKSSKMGVFKNGVKKGGGGLNYFSYIRYRSIRKIITLVWLMGEGWSEKVKICMTSFMLSLRSLIF